MKLTYDNCDQLKLVNGNLVHRASGKVWAESDKPCTCCGDDFLRRVDNGKLSDYCEQNCYHIWPSNALKVRAITGKIPKLRTSGENKSTKKVTNAMKAVYEKKKEQALEEMSSDQIAALRSLQREKNHKSIEIETAQEVIGPQTLSNVGRNQEKNR